MPYIIIEKRNPLAVHGYFDSLERAEYHLSTKIRVMVEGKQFADKTLTADDFEIKEKVR